jgi:protein-disulfide isomerase
LVAFEEVFGATLASMAQAGDVKLVFHTLSFVDLDLKNDSSSRSANAAACAADAGRFPGYHSAVFAGQPEKEGAGYTDAQLTQQDHDRDSSPVRRGNHNGDGPRSLIRTLSSCSIRQPTSR